ncbi:MAG: chromosome segregation ATPase [Spirulina sp. DLM2.Bin59]|nr:MAG: chromosome segregation ATPase [Spirulina sp. DLM2.Bin59]
MEQVMKSNSNYSPKSLSPQDQPGQGLNDGFHIIGSRPRPPLPRVVAPLPPPPPPAPPQSPPKAREVIGDKTPPPPEPNLSPRRRFLQQWGWPIAGVALVLTTSGVGLIATAMLLKLPSAPNCPGIFLPTASASMRLYCAQLAASKGTAADLLEAVRLVQSLPPNHPLYPEIQRYLEVWSQDLLQLGEEKFHNGELNEAIALARQISHYFDNPTLINDTIARWQKIWDEGEEIIAQTIALKAEGAWGQAFQMAAGLTRLSNRYFATQRYDQLFEELTFAQQESKQLDESFAQLERGGLDNLLKAIASARQIPPTSSAYNEAQTLINEAKKKLVALAMERLRNGNASGAMDVVNQIPAALGLNAEIRDLTTLADAATVASFGAQVNYEDAIATAQEISTNRPLYREAQELIGLWRQAIEGGVRLDAAIALAREGSIRALDAAIAQARTIQPNTPRHGQAQSLIRDWSRQREILADQPKLDTANRLANEGNLEGAIRQAQQISTGHGLANQAQRQIQGWQRDLEARETQPQLDRANALAQQGRYNEAIAILQEIPRGNRFYNEAQRRLREWQQQQSSPSNPANPPVSPSSPTPLEQAQRQAQVGTPEALQRAIAQAQQIPRNSSQFGAARQNINQWSAALLNLARQRASSSLSEAIAIARSVPVDSASYNAAQAQIATWEATLNPLPTIPEG